MSQFVEGWHLLYTLGEGRFGEVKLLINQQSKEMVAVKVIQVPDDAAQAKQIQREVSIHSMLEHANVIGFYGNRRDNGIEYLFLEYARGVLFDRIEPDKGLSSLLAFKYFTGIISALAYLHSKGIVHRDVKPENLLLDEEDNIKLCDFGLATIFRLKGRERKLDQLCGSYPYMAPEVLAGEKYLGPPIDIWSAGVVLVAMLTGHLPWDQASEDQEDYKEWITGQHQLHLPPWRQIDTFALSLLRSILEPNVGKRYSIEKIRSHCWFKEMIRSAQETGDDEILAGELHDSKRICYGFLSQPNSKVLVEEEDEEQDSNKGGECITSDRLNCFSQPAIKIDNMLLSTQTQWGQGYSSPDVEPGSRLYFQIIKRLTRFCLLSTPEKTVAALVKTFKDLNYNYKRDSVGQWTITINDKKRMPLMFRCSTHEMGAGRMLVDFRLSKGDGIEFKRQFLAIKSLLQALITEHY